MKYLTIFLHLVVTIVSMLLCELHLWEVLRISRSCMHCSCLIMRPPHAIACSSPNDPHTKPDTPPNENMSALVNFCMWVVNKTFQQPIPSSVATLAKSNPTCIQNKLHILLGSPCFSPKSTPALCWRHWDSVTLASYGP